jgi:hypothetical protein
MNEWRSHGIELGIGNWDGFNRHNNLQRLVWGRVARTMMRKRLDDFDWFWMDGINWKWTL